MAPTCTPCTTTRKVRSCPTISIEETILNELRCGLAWMKEHIEALEAEIAEIKAAVVDGENN